MKKFIVRLYAEDGSYEKHFANAKSVITYFTKDEGIRVDSEKIEEIPDTHKSYSVQDSWGRRFTVFYTDVKQCPVCKKSRGLSRISCEQKNGKGEYLGRVGVEVCLSCYSDYELGCWSIGVRAGNPIIKKNKGWC